jgi:hypothetical protein
MSLRERRARLLRPGEVRRLSRMQVVRSWLEEKRRKARSAPLTEADLDELQALLDDPPAPRQQILYLHAGNTSPLSRVVGMTLYRPGQAQDDGSLEPGEFPYRTVMEAVEDGWRILQFPVPPTDFSDDRVDYLGFEFVLEKWSA